MRQLAALPIEEAFDRIYKQGIWSHQGEALSGGGSYGRVADEYVALLADFIQKRRVESILDIGCGDFNVGARIAPLVRRYIAVDVSARIIARNKSLFASLPNVEFRQCDACIEPLTSVDLVTVRQVFQHLTNAQISRILENIERSRIELALITEHVSGPTVGFKPNVDLPGHSSMTRVTLSSGVVLSAPPFSRHAGLLGSISLANGGGGGGGGGSGGGGDGEALNVYLWYPRTSQCSA